VNATGALENERKRVRDVVKRRVLGRKEERGDGTRRGERRGSAAPGTKKKEKGGLD